MKEFVLLGNHKSNNLNYWVKDGIHTIEEAEKLSKKLKNKGFKSFQILCFDTDKDKLKKGLYRAIFHEAKRILNFKY